MINYDRLTSYYFCLGGKLHSLTTNVKSAISFKKKTRKDIEIEIFKDGWSKCGRTKTKTVSGNTIEAGGLGNIFKSMGKAAESFPTKVVNNPKKALALAAHLSTTAATIYLKALPATAPSVVTFIHQGTYKNQNSLFPKMFIVKKTESLTLTSCKKIWRKPYNRESRRIRKIKEN